MATEKPLELEAAEKCCAINERLQCGSCAEAFEHAYGDNQVCFAGNCIFRFLRFADLEAKRGIRSAG
ncbi:hypothetical protein [Tritonibacter mobilis]|uniref:hypothetical protein n=1 Tax=Tritonibacter mobilis TaxID=379347 RepID=UPI000806E0AC|nr:hypothetical protein [Tritonibacter mobilis]GLP86907.1 hypothetical protein GCM10007921_24670 [Tritonibacter mobilis]SDW56291.1 hypothetical protein SAMN05444385_102577 [Tritonibacter mobilis]